jgi:hypothetical protein
VCHLDLGNDIENYTFAHLVASSFGLPRFGDLSSSCLRHFHNAGLQPELACRSYTPHSRQQVCLQGLDSSESTHSAITATAVTGAAAPVRCRRLIKHLLCAGSTSSAKNMLYSNERVQGGCLSINVSSVKQRLCNANSNAAPEAAAGTVLPVCDCSVLAETVSSVLLASRQHGTRTCKQDCGTSAQQQAAGCALANCNQQPEPRRSAPERSAIKLEDCFAASYSAHPANNDWCCRSSQTVLRTLRMSGRTGNHTSRRCLASCALHC